MIKKNKYYKVKELYEEIYNKNLICKKCKHYNKENNSCWSNKNINIVKTTNQCTDYKLDSSKYKAIDKTKILKLMNENIEDRITTFDFYIYNLRERVDKLEVSNKRQFYIKTAIVTFIVLGTIFGFNKLELIKELFEWIAMFI